MTVEVPDWTRPALLVDPQDVWGNIVGMGLGELATRLGFPGGFDNRGQVIFLDMFENGMAKGIDDFDGTGASVVVSSTSVRSGGLSLLLTGGSDGDRYAKFRYILPYPVLSKLGIQIAFAHSPQTEYLIVDFSLYDGVNQHNAQIRYDPPNDKLQYFDSSGAWQDLLTSIPLVEAVHTFHHLKMVIDLEKDAYHRVLLDSYSWITGGIPMYVTGSPSAPQVTLDIKLVSQPGLNPYCYLDNVIITQNEED